MPAGDDWERWSREVRTDRVVWISRDRAAGVIVVADAFGDTEIRTMKGES